ASRPNQPAFNLIARHFPYILVAFLLFFLLFLLEGTRIVVTDAAMQRVTPSAVLQRNRMLVCAGFAVALAISLIPTVATALAAIGNTLKLGIKKLLLLLSSLLPSMESGATGTPQASQDLSGMIESSDPSLFAIWSERILLVLAFIAAVIVIFFLLRFLFRKLKLLLGILVERFSGFLQSTTEDYVDEVTDLRDIDEHREHLRLRKKKRVLSQHPTDAQLVRYAYGRYLDQNKQIRQSQTARESLSLADAKIYERVRYGLDQGVDKQDLERFIDHLHN
ncbi:MAG: hypothetical protein IJ719_05080, partial [Clostridia bacterium]|nr:hypothetical protein [Clostridia bacterium]